MFGGRCVLGVFKTSVTITFLQIVQPPWGCWTWSLQRAARSRPEIIPIHPSSPSATLARTVLNLLRPLPPMSSFPLVRPFFHSSLPVSAAAFPSVKIDRL